MSEEDKCSNVSPASGDVVGCYPSVGHSGTETKWDCGDPGGSSVADGKQTLLLLVKCMLELLLLSEAAGAGLVCPALSQDDFVSLCLYLPEVNAAATVKAGSCCDQNDVVG